MAGGAGDVHGASAHLQGQALQQTQAERQGEGGAKGKEQLQPGRRAHQRTRGRLVPLHQGRNHLLSIMFICHSKNCISLFLII